jgi:phasin
MIDTEMKKAAKAATATATVTPMTPKFEVPEAFRAFAEKGVEQAKDAYARMKTAAEETTDLMEDTYLSVSKGTADFNLKALEALRANVNSSFDYTREILATKSLSEAVELSATHMRKQFDALSAQTKERSMLAQKVATEASEPIKTAATKFKVQ